MYKGLSTTLFIQQLVSFANCYLHQRTYSQAREKQMLFRLPLEWSTTFNAV